MRRNSTEQSGWEKLKSKPASQTVQQRDVYETQDLERSRIEPKKTSGAYDMTCLIVGAAVAILVYFMISAIQWGVGTVMSSMPTAGQVMEQITTSQANPWENGSSQDMTPWGSESGPNWAPDVSKPDYPNVGVKTETGNGPGVQTQKPVQAQPVQKPVERSNPFAPSWLKILVSLVLGAAAGFGLRPLLLRRLATQNAMRETTDINQYPNDQHIAYPEEIYERYDWFPDAGAHANVSVTTLISHAMLSNKGLKHVKVTKRLKKDIVDGNGDIVQYAGEPVYDKDGNIQFEEKPLIDEKFGQEIYQAAYDGQGVPKEYWLFADTTEIEYNPGDRNRNKQKGFPTVAELINSTWHIPYYETQRPAGAYQVDTQPANTMILAITRAGKGQTIIEPTVDMWSRCDVLDNMVVNDPKGELLCKFYVPLVRRGYQVVQFNLMNVLHTDIYNPLLLAIQSARAGDMQKMAMYIQGLSDVFFPVNGAEEPMWPNAAAAAFRRAAFGLIDYYCEEEKELRIVAARNNMDARTLESKVDELWGHCTLYNAYQMFVQLTSKRMKNPITELSEQWQEKYNTWKKLANGRPVAEVFGNDPEYQKYAEQFDRAKAEAFLWDGKPNVDLCTLFFNAVAALPRNQVRTNVKNADDQLKTMAGAEKMLASVYGIAVTGMSFFVDPTIATLTSGTPSQNADLGALAFPRRIGVRFHTDFIQKYHLTGLQVKWDSFEDPGFTKNLGKDFEHTDIVSGDGWAMYCFEGIYKNDTSYIRAQIVNPQTGLLIRTFYFKFEKLYQMSLNARRFVKEPVLDEKIIKNGLLTELRCFEKKDGTLVYKPARTTFKKKVLKSVEPGSKPVDDDVAAVVQTSVDYSEKPKAVFLLTPPHMMSYAKLLLILIKQLTDLNFEKSYMTKSDQKP